LSPITCPATAPMQGSMCTSVPGGGNFNECTWGATSCSCQNAGGAAAGQAWACTGPIACPTAAPMTGDMCSVSGGGAANNRCNYGATQCTCQSMGGGMADWNCVTPIACPTTSPTTGQACTVAGGGVVNNVCSYGTGRCTCAMSGGTASWTCNNG
jgi:hypothetical protein